MQIVIVSDHSEQVASLRALALDAGLEQVEGFTHPAAALDWCIDHTPDLILADYMMRACDGLEFLRRARALAHLAEVPIVLMLPPLPGLGSLRAAAWKLGATDFLSSPVDHTEFVARVRNLLLLRCATQPRVDSDRLAQAESAAGLDSRWLETPALAAAQSLAQFH